MSGPKPGATASDADDEILRPEDLAAIGWQSPCARVLDVNRIVHGHEAHRDRFPAPPDETDPSLQFAHYVVTWLPMSVTVGSADHMTREQLEAARAGGVLVLTKAELLSEWRKRYLADKHPLEPTMPVTRC